MEKIYNTIMEQLIYRMVRKFQSSLILCLLIWLYLIVSFPSYAGTILWDFENNTNDWKVINGNWEVKDGVYQVIRDVNIEYSLVGDEGWDDYTIEAKIRLDEHNWAGIVFRAESDMEYYVYYLSVQDNKTELWKHTEGAWVNREKIAQMPVADGVTLKNGEWYIMKIDIKSNIFTLHINGKWQMDNSDEDYSKGKVGVWAWKTTASVDYFSIEGAKIKNTQDVNPAQKIATLWGTLKGEF